MSELSIIMSRGTREDQSNANSQFKLISLICAWKDMHLESSTRYPLNQSNINKILHMNLKSGTKHFCYFQIYSYEPSLPFREIKWLWSIKIQLTVVIHFQMYDQYCYEFSNYMYFGIFRFWLYNSTLQKFIACYMLIQQTARREEQIIYYIYICIQLRHLDTFWT